MSKSAPKFVAVYGALRSGTTVLRLMLDQNPDLSCPGETDFVFDHLQKDADGTWRYDTDALQRDRIYCDFRDQFGDRAGSNPSMDDMIASMGQPGQTVVLMLHRNLGKALDHYPDLRVIHMVRDPRDVARSSIGMGWAGNEYFGVQHWINTETEWAAHAARLPDENLLTLTFESLIETPEDQLDRMCRFMGTTYRDAMLNYDDDTTYSKPDTSLTYQWKRKQTPRQIGLVEGKVGPLLEALGYTPSGHPRIIPGAVEHLRLRFENRRRIWAKKFQRYGILDPLLVTLSHRLHLPSLGHAAQRRIDKKMLNYMK